MIRLKTATSLFLLVLCSELHAAQSPQLENGPPIPARRILILNEVNASYPGIRIIDDAIRESLKGSKYHVEIYREYMETSLFPDVADQELFREFYLRKYHDRRPDLIITVGSSPLKFMTEKHREFFPGIPVIFCLPNGAENGLKPDPKVTGVRMGTEAAATLEAALRLLPNTKHVLVVGGAGVFDLQTVKEVKEQLQDYGSRIDISYTTELAMPELLQRLHSLTPDYIVLFTSMGRDSAGTYYSSRESGPLIDSASSVPVFSLFDVYIGHGQVGGNVSKLSAQGTMAGNVALKILDGVNPSDIPIAKASNGFVFDWRALKRWGLKESKLPPGSSVLNRQPTVWEAYKWHILGGLSLMLLEALLISGLLVQRKRARKAETELSVTNDRLRLAVEAGNSVGWDWDVRSGRDQWFGDLETVFGIRSDTYSGHVDDFRRKVHPEDRELVWNAVSDARRNRKPYVAEFRVLREDGSERWVNAKGKFYYAPNGDAERMLGMAVDITDRRRAEAAARESEERFRLVANTAPVFIWTSGIDKLCDYVNLPWLEFTGRRPEEELRDGWTSAVHPQDLTFCLDTYTSAFDRRERFEMQYRLRRHDGEYRWFFDRGVPRFKPDGSFVGYIGSCIDVTERKLAEDALAGLNGQLIEAQEEERRRIAREIHDDYNQRLAVVANDLDELRELLENSSSVEAGQRFRELWNQVSELAADLHSLSHRLHSSTLERLGLVEGVKGFCNEFGGQHGLRVDFTHENVPNSVPPDAALCLFRIAQEALRNVARHSGADRAAVKLEWTGERLHLSIHDHGNGFNSDWRLAQTGIGIRSMEERLRLVGGKLEIYSRHAEGTRIDAWLPFQVAGQRAG